MVLEIKLPVTEIPGREKPIHPAVENLPDLIEEQAKKRIALDRASRPESSSPPEYAGQ